LDNNSLRSVRLPQAHLYGAVVSGDYEGAFPRRFTLMLRDLAGALGEVLVDHVRLTRLGLAALEGSNSRRVLGQVKAS
jgi:hypothetical protein